MNTNGLTLAEVATVLEGFAAAIGIIFALAGIALVYIQLREHRAIQREATAKGLFREYLREAIKRPELALPDLDDLRQQGRFIQYELFVANMLYALDEILQNTRSDDWREVVRGEITRHAEHLCSPAFQDQRRYYETEMIQIIDEMCDGAV